MTQEHTGANAEDANKSAQGKKKRPAPTEEELVYALQEWEAGAAYRQARHAANAGGCYSAETICLAHETLENQRLTDDLVRCRLAQGAQGEFTTAELNPKGPWVTSLCEYVSTGVLNRMLLGMRGTLSADDAYDLCDYCIGRADETTLSLIADKTRFTPTERREFLEAYRELVGPAQVSYVQPVSQAVVLLDKKEGEKGPHKTLLVVAVGAVLSVIVAVVAIASGLFLLLIVAAVIFIAAVLSSSSGKKRKQGDVFPDKRSNYRRRVWADDHNWEADSDSDHNWEADGDHPW